MSDNARTPWVKGGEVHPYPIGWEDGVKAERARIREFAEQMREKSDPEADDYLGSAHCALSVLIDFLDKESV